MATLHPRLPPHNDNTLGSQKSDILPGRTEIESKTSKMVTILIRVQYQIGAHGRNKNDPVGQLVKTTGLHSGQQHRQ